MSDNFPEILGQKSLKAKLDFGLQTFAAKEVLPFYLFAGAKGLGKSMVAKAFGRAIYKKDKEYKWIEINCAKFKKAADLFDSPEFQNEIVGQKRVVFADETHNLPFDIVNSFLTIFATDGGPQRTIPHNGLTIDLRDQIFLFGTSEPDKIFAPLRDRFEVVTIAKYSNADLKNILINRFPDITINSDLAEEIVIHTKGTPRSVVEMAKKVNRYCSIKKTKEFSAADWKALLKMDDIKIHGLDSVELNILKILAERGPCSLNELRAVTGLSRMALINNHEINLLKTNFMKINQKREITTFGRKILENFKSI